MIAVNQFKIIKVWENFSENILDYLAVEEPLEIRIVYFDNGISFNKVVSITMCTPGQDEELALGFLYTEGIIQSYHQIAKVEVGTSANHHFVIVTLANDVQLDLSKLERNFYTTSSCGVCGKSSINAIKTIRAEFGNDKFEIKLTPSTIYSLPQKLIQKQKVFQSTGGLHASALFNFDGELISLREDVGRHNALDKLIGDALKNKMIPLNGSILLLSGRASFELIQKAYMAGIKVIVAIGAPSSLAVELATESDITLIGFLRQEKFNIYSSSYRIEN